MIVELIGYVGAACFAICAVPQALASWRQGHSNGISWMFLLLWTVGEVLTLAYIVATTAQPPLLINYTANLLCLCTILWYRAKPRATHEHS